MIIISNGHDKFHMGRAAVELAKLHLLDLYITGAYPTGLIKKLTNLFKLNNKFPSIDRLIKREESGLPSISIRSLWLSEILNQLSSIINSRTSKKNIAEKIKVIALKLYGSQSKSLISSTQSKIYHYRAGYGHTSVDIAKDMGLVPLCDYSIAHPSLVDYLIDNKGLIPLHPNYSELSPFWRYIQEDINRSNHVLVNSQFVKDTFTLQGWDPNRVHVAYLGIDDEFLDASNYHYERKEHTKGFLKDSSNSIKLLFAGEFCNRKGSEEIVKALFSLTDISWTLDIAGPISKHVENRYKNFLLDGRICIKGVLSRFELARCMSEADIFIFPSLAEGSARVIFEALVSGCYVITTPNSGSIVEDGIHGALINAGDSSALMAALKNASSNFEKIKKIGLNNRKLVVSKFTQEKYGEELIKIYKKIII